MPVESPSDRAALLNDFGSAVRIRSRRIGELRLTAIVEAPSAELAGQASELEFRIPDLSALVRTEETLGVRVEDELDVLDGPYCGEYVVTDRVREDDGAFTALALGRR